MSFLMFVVSPSIHLSFFSPPHLPFDVWAPFPHLPFDDWSPIRPILYIYNVAPKLRGIFEKVNRNGLFQLNLFFSFSQNIFQTRNNNR